MNRLKKENLRLFMDVGNGKLSLHRACIKMGWRKLTHPYPTRILHMFEMAHVFVAAPPKAKIDKRLFLKALDRVLSETESMVIIYNSEFKEKHPVVARWKKQYKSKVSAKCREVVFEGNRLAAFNQAYIGMLDDYVIAPTQKRSCVAIVFGVDPNNDDEVKNFKFASMCRKRGVKVWYPEKEW